MFKTANELLSFIKSNEVKYVDFRFTDFKQWHHITYTAEHITQQTIESGVGFDGSSIPGWKEINNSDMVLLPDISSAFVDPFSVHECLVVTCDVIDPSTGKNYDRDPRSLAKRAEKYLKESGVADVAYFGPELEFFIFDDVVYKNEPHSCMFNLDSHEGPHNCSTQYPDGNKGYRPEYKGGYFPVQPIDSLFDVRSEICATLESVGIKVTLHHHEVAASQCEIGFEFGTVVGAADNVQKFKYVTKNVTDSFGKTTTFMPKPIFGDNGSGMHTHQSLWKNGDTLFFEKGGYADLSEIALYYIGGIIRHAKAINAFSNPTTNSYKRLVPGFEAPVNLAYSACNRSAAIRIPYVNSSKAKRIEVRFPDPLANPYLTFAAMLMAGLDGIRNKIHPGESVDKNLYELPSEELKNIPSVCGSLREALEHLDRDREFLKQGNVFNDELIDAYIKLRMEEVHAYEMAPHPIEFKMYYSG